MGESRHGLGKSVQNDDRVSEDDRVSLQFTSGQFNSVFSLFPKKGALVQIGSQDPASSGSLCCWALKSLDEASEEVGKEVRGPEWTSRGSSRG